MSDHFLEKEYTLEAHNLFYHYGSIKILTDVSLALKSGEKVALIGPSGTGKSTFLNVLGLMDKPQKGKIIFHTPTGPIQTGRLTEEQRTNIRRHMIGFIYQFHHLLPEFTALENVMLPQLFTGISREKAAFRARNLLKRVGLTDRIDHKPSQLSGGQQQRVAIARALANKPRIILADEPTGSLDEETSASAFKLFMQLSQEEKTSLLVATHNLFLCAYFDRVLTLDRGRMMETFYCNSGALSTIVSFSQTELLLFLNTLLIDGAFYSVQVSTLC